MPGVRVGSAQIATRMSGATIPGEIDLLVARFFSVFDNRGPSRPRAADLANCFAEKATIVRYDPAGPEILSVIEFATPRIKLLTEGKLLDFHEWEDSSTTQVFGGIAARLSRYGKAGVLEGSAYSGSGTKCFHLIDTHLGWRISSLAWIDD